MTVTSDLAYQLSRLSDLLEDGLLTEDEFGRAKTRVLDGPEAVVPAALVGNPLGVQGASAVATEAVPAVMVGPPKSKDDAVGWLLVGFVGGLLMIVLVGVAITMTNVLVPAA